MIEGLIEAVSPQSVLLGWVRDVERAAPCRVRISHAGTLVADAMANQFRADLLRAGHGHGHYGFAARLHRMLPAGPCSLMLEVPHLGISAAMGVVVPPLTPASPLSVEALLGAPPGWSTEDLLAMPGCIDPDGNLARMGPARFVDAMFRFVLDRWPSPAEARVHGAALKSGRLSALSFLRDMLTSRERADLPPQLASPFDVAFPFGYGDPALR